VCYREEFDTEMVDLNEYDVGNKVSYSFLTRRQVSGTLASEKVENWPDGINLKCKNG
jgi:hypothetical protein